MPTFSSSARFNLVSNLLVITDTTDFAGQGLTISQFDFKITVSAVTSTGNLVVYTPPSGASYDIHPNTSRLNIHAISLPLDSDGKALDGVYTVSIAVFQSGVQNDSYAYTNVYTFTNPCVTMDLQSTIDCAASTILSEDVTDYGVSAISITRLHRVFPPPVLALSPYTNALAALTVTGIYSTTWTQEVISDILYRNADGSYTSIQYTGIREFEVVCDDDMCKILCCLNNLKSTYDRLVCKNPTAAMQMKEDRIDAILLDATMFMLSKDCGNATKAALYLQQVMDASGCTTDCSGCNGLDDAPVFITPSSSSSATTYVVDSPDVSVAVTSTVVGSTTTYHVQVSSAIQTLIATFYNTTVSTSTPSYLTVVTTGTNPKNYAVNFTGSIPTAYNRVHLKILIAETSAGSGAAAITLTVIDALTGKFKVASGIVGTLNGAGAAVQLAFFTITNFLTTPTTPYIAHADLMGYYGGTNPTFANTLGLEVHWFHLTTDQLVLRFYDTNAGVAIAWKDVFTRSGGKDVYIALSLY